VRRLRRIALGAVVGLIWLSATFGVAVAAVEWRQGGDSVEDCQAPVAYFNAVNSITTSTERVGITGALVIHANDTLADAWGRAFTNMKQRCQ